MKLFKYTLLILLFFLNSCDEKEDTRIEYSSETLQWIENGMQFTCGGGDNDLRFYYNGKGDVTVDIIYEGEYKGWLETYQPYSEGKEWAVRIHCYAYDNTSARRATLIVHVGKKSFSVSVNQRGKGFATPEKTQYVSGNEGGTIEIPIKSNGHVSASIYFDTLAWIESKVINKNGEYVLSLSIEKNDGLGRVAFVKIAVDGVNSATVAVRQKPSQLPSNLVISTKGPGQLFVLLGADENGDFRNVRELTIYGSLNGLDLYILKKFGFQGAVGLACPLNLDLFDARLYKGTECYYPDLEIELIDPVPYVEDGVLPMDQFQFADNLRSIILPNSLRVIENRCFYA